MRLNAIRDIYERVEKGDWVRDIPEMPGLALHVRGIGCIAFEHARQKRIERRPAAQRQFLNDAAAEYREMGEVLAETILLGWEGLEDENGAAIPFSQENALKLLTDPELRAFQNATRFAALKVSVPAPAAEETTAA